jgi:signal transduction histidine kinase/signal recognition particle receptor subunit beta
MAQFRHAQREIQFKVVYYGPALGGKTTNLEALHELTDPEGKTQLVSLKTAEDRTLFFDFLPFDLGEIQGYHIRFQVYTVPGQVHYNTTRKVVLSGADAIVFVADSQTDRAMENFISWENMKANLLANKMDLRQTPVVVQCNKRDLPGVLSPERILKAMKVEDYPVMLASALTGEGVVETFLACIKRALVLFAEKYKLDQKGATPERIAAGAAEVFEPFLQRRRKAAAPPPQAPLAAKLPLHGLTEEEQLVAALQSSTQLAEEYQEAQLLSRMYQARLQEMTVLHEIGQSLARTEEVAEGLAETARHLAAARPHWKVSAFLSGDEGPAPLLCLGCAEDPLWSADAPGAGNLALGLLQRGERISLDNLQDRFRRLKASVPPDVGEAHAIPLGPQGRPMGFLIVYTPPELPLTKEEDRFLALLEQAVSQRLQNLALLGQLAQANERLEVKVVERTAELQEALERLKEMDQLKRAFLNNVSHEMKTPLTNIRSYADLLRRYPQHRDEHGDEYLQIVHDESVRLEGLINDLLSYTKVKEPPRGEACDLSAVLDEVLAALAPAAAQKHLMVQVQKDDQLFHEMNREDAAVLFRQIADNALKFSPEGVKVKIYLLHDARKVIFAARDYGPGFPKDQRERLLEPLEPGHPAVPSYKNPGLGIGLFLVKEVLAKYRGGIAIENMEPGSNVLVELPRAKPAS